MPSQSPSSRSLGRVFGRALLVLVALIGLHRLAVFVAYAYWEIGDPFEAYYLEAKMAHLAWRVQHGVRLYPPWRDGPYVANFFGPAYFALVGGIGKAAGATLAQLFLIGRGVTLSADLGMAALVGLVAARRWGPGLGVLSAVLAIGVGPMFGFGLMVRPDTTADLLGFAGFLLATTRGRGRVLVGGLVLALAVLTKQTAALYLAAACLALIAEGRSRAGLALGLAVTAGLAALVGGVTAFYEPEFGPGLLGESRTPWDLPAYGVILKRFLVVCPDLTLGAILAPVIWWSGPRPERRLAILAAVMAVGCTVAAGKMGSDLNYFLPLRGVVALAIVEVGGRLRDAAPRQAWTRALLLGLIAWALVLSDFHAAYQARNSFAKRSLHESPEGRQSWSDTRLLLERLRDPSFRFLTDSGRLDIEQGGRTTFGDPWLLRVLVETGRIRPDRLRSAIEAEEFRWIITSEPMESPSYDAYDFRLPAPLVTAARRHYVRERQLNRFFFYRPIGASQIPETRSPRG